VDVHDPAQENWGLGKLVTRKGYGYVLKPIKTGMKFILSTNKWPIYAVVFPFFATISLISEYFHVEDTD
jgi:hypothetical protein